MAAPPAHDEECVACRRPAGPLLQCAACPAALHAACAGYDGPGVQARPWVCWECADGEAGFHFPGMLRPPAVGDTLLVAHMDEVNYECNYEVFYRGQVTRTTATRVTVRWLDYQDAPRETFLLGDKRLWHGTLDPAAFHVAPRDSGWEPLSRRRAHLRAAARARRARLPADIGASPLPRPTPRQRRRHLPHRCTPAGGTAPVVPEHSGPGGAAAAPKRARLEEPASASASTSGAGARERQAPADGGPRAAAAPAGSPGASVVSPLWPPPASPGSLHRGSGTEPPECRRSSPQDSCHSPPLSNGEGGPQQPALSLEPSGGGGGAARAAHDSRRAVPEGHPEELEFEDDEDGGPEDDFVVELNASVALEEEDAVAGLAGAEAAQGVEAAPAQSSGPPSRLQRGVSGEGSGDGDTSGGSEVYMYGGGGGAEAPVAAAAALGGAEEAGGACAGPPQTSGPGDSDVDVGVLAPAARSGLPPPRSHASATSLPCSAAPGTAGAAQAEPWATPPDSALFAAAAAEAAPQPTELLERQGEAAAGAAPVFSRYQERTDRGPGGRRRKGFFLYDATAGAWVLSVLGEARSDYHYTFAPVGPFAGQSRAPAWSNVAGVRSWLKGQLSRCRARGAPLPPLPPLPPYAQPSSSPSRAPRKRALPPAAADSLPRRRRQLASDLAAGPAGDAEDFGEAGEVLTEEDAAAAALAALRDDPAAAAAAARRRRPAASTALGGGLRPSAAAEALAPGDAVDVRALDDPGFRGGWFGARVLEVSRPAGPSPPHFFFVRVEYSDLVSDAGDPDRAWIPLAAPLPRGGGLGVCVRPAASPRRPSARNWDAAAAAEAEGWESGDRVEAFYSDGWWMGDVRYVAGDVAVVDFDPPPRGEGDSLRLALRELRRADPQEAEHFGMLEAAGSW